MTSSAIRIGTCKPFWLDRAQVISLAACPVLTVGGRRDQEQDY